MGVAEDFVNTLRQGFPDLVVEEIPNRHKYRAFWPDGSYVDVHQANEPYFSAHYQRPDGHFMRWNNAHNSNDPHVHCGKLDGKHIIYHNVNWRTSERITYILKIIKYLEGTGDIP